MTVMKKYTTIIISAFLVLGMTGCQDFLIEKPHMSLTDELATATIEDMDKNVAGAYAYIGSGAWYSSDFIIQNEMKSSNGMKHLGKSDHGYFHDEWNLNFRPDNTSPLWGTAYSIIDAANKILVNLEGKGTEEERNNYRAEALFMRALAHFDLVRTYALPYSYTEDHSHLGVPLILTPQALTDQPARATVKTVYEQVINDLLEAESLIDPKYIRKGTDPHAYASVQVIQALLSRVYLYAEEWQASADYAAKVIDSKKYSLWTKEDLKDGACYCQDVPEKGEVIFQFYDAAENSVRSNLFDMATADGAYGDAACSKSLVDLYESDDVRSTLFKKKDGKYWSLKYGGKGLGKPDYTNVIILRLSEMYLNIAEACVNGATGYNGVDYLNTLAESRGATPATLTKKGVFNERRKEFAWEAHLWFDHARCGYEMVRTDYEGNDKAKVVEAKDKRWAMPIPSREILVNSNLKQNEY